MASVLTFLVVSATGYAVLIMTRDNIASSVSSDLQFNTNRASDFIVDEIKQASFISIDPGVLPTGCPALTSGEQFVFALAIGSSTTVNVVYYTKTPPAVFGEVRVLFIVVDSDWPPMDHIREVLILHREFWWTPFQLQFQHVRMKPLL
ncbi:hypothetical protein NON20_19715 [Synechocystis sp. B12]|nr:hypothetical protein NON20_19715 [Synechocystis sp. B12]